MTNFHVDHERHADLLADIERVSAKANETLQRRPLSTSDVAWAMHCFERLSEDLDKVFAATVKDAVVR